MRLAASSGWGWSQTNDNVFTLSPRPTANQDLHWPIMHPIDIICGLYTYLCLQQPFTLRPDGVSARPALYDLIKDRLRLGRLDILLNASQVAGELVFPTGQGMQGVNVVRAGAGSSSLHPPILRAGIPLRESRERSSANPTATRLRVRIPR